MLRFELNVKLTLNTLCYVCSVVIYYNVYHFKKHGKFNILYEKRSKERNCKVYRKVAPTTKWREIKGER